MGVYFFAGKEGSVPPSWDRMKEDIVDVLPRSLNDPLNLLNVDVEIKQTIRDVEAWIPYKGEDAESIANGFFGKESYPRFFTSVAKTDINNHDVRARFSPTLKRDGKEYRLIQTRLCVDKEAILAKIRCLK